MITRLVPGGALTRIIPSETPRPVVTRVLPSAPVQVTRIVQAAPAVTQVAESVDPNPQYNFGYSISDTITGDAKTREEARNGDVVTG